MAESVCASTTVVVYRLTVPGRSDEVAPLRDVVWLCSDSDGALSAFSAARLGWREVSGTMNEPLLTCVVYMSQLGYGIRLLLYVSSSAHHIAVLPEVGGHSPHNSSVCTLVDGTSRGYMDRLAGERAHSCARSSVAVDLFALHRTDGGQYLSSSRAVFASLVAPVRLSVW